MKENASGKRRDVKHKEKSIHYSEALASTGKVFIPRVITTTDYKNLRDFAVICRKKKK